MSNIQQHIDFVNDQVRFHRRKAVEFQGKKRSELHTTTAEKFQSLLNFLESVPELITNNRPSKPHQLSFSLTPRDLEGLPQELLEELSVSNPADKAEFAIMKLMEEKGRIMSLDQILIGIYRETGEVTKRQAMTSRLYRMINKGVLFSVPSKKGVYSLDPAESGSGDGNLESEKHDEPEDV